MSNLFFNCPDTHLATFALFSPLPQIIYECPLPFKQRSASGSRQRFLPL